MAKPFSPKKFLVDNNTYIIFILLFLACLALNDRFFTVMNLRNIALQRAAPICMALGMLFVILTGGIDLSVGSVMAFSACTSAMFFTKMELPLWLALVLALAFSTVIGLVNGILVAYGRMQGFVASLAMMTIARGMAFVITNGTPIKFKLGSIDALVKKQYGYPILLITLFVIIALWVVQHYTLYGRIVVATGSNRNAVELAGIPVRRYLTSVYALSGFLAGLGGLYVAARSSSGNATIGLSQELDAIAACVIGGASLAGGYGFVVK
ncbi:MAG: ABC transporter permease, partial [Planctomycetes bacterium]|nr:ABC transporter permease [Planctomycetota bacterium]